LRLRLIRNRHVRIDVVLDAAGLVDFGGVHLEPVRARRPLHEGRAPHVRDLRNRLTRREPVRDLDDGAVGVAVQQDVALGVHHDGAAHLV
jgi:hypothetical protein